MQDFSGHLLIPHLSALENRFTTPLQNDDARFRSTFFDLEMLPYALGGAWYAWYELARIQHEIVAAIPVEQFDGNTILGLGRAERDAMSYAVDAFFDAMRRSQNAVIHYLSRGLKTTLPNSMTDLVEGLKKGKFKVPNPPRQGIIDYWNQHGQQLKHYRDLAQHHALITSDARAFRAEDGRVGFYFLLPSNPEQKAAARLVFGTPRIHVYEYVREQFKRLLVFIYWLTKGLVRPDDGGMSLMIFREPLTLGGTDGFSAPDPAKVYTAGLEYARKLRGE